MNEDRVKLLNTIASTFLIIGCFRIVVENSSLEHDILGIFQAIGFLLYAFPSMYKKWSSVLS